MPQRKEQGSGSQADVMALANTFQFFRLQQGRSRRGAHVVEGVGTRTGRENPRIEWRRRDPGDAVLGAVLQQCGAAGAKQRVLSRRHDDIDAGQFGEEQVYFQLATRIEGTIE